jgi:hypothetical protein
MATSLSMAVTDLQHKIETFRVQCADEGRSFIPNSPLQRYLTEQVLYQLLDELSISHGDFYAIRHNYLRVFVILIYIDKGAEISNFTGSERLRDYYLPFDDTDRQKWPEECRDFFPQFYKAQWQFCVRRWEKGWLTGVLLDDNTLLPIKEQDDIHKGSNSQTSTITLYSEYNGLNSVV